jgi:putative tryptophan/tyrosine transport system substrate-binding protein
MRRREFIKLLGGATAAWPFSVRAQQVGMPVIGFMSARSPDDSKYLVAAFHQGLGEAGFQNGQNVMIEYRWARGDYRGLLPAFAVELVQRRVNVLVATGGEASDAAAKRATSTIPIVFVMGDPVRAGLVESLNRPGGNATGPYVATELPGRRTSVASV